MAKLVDQWYRPTAQSVTDLPVIIGPIKLNISIIVEVFLLMMLQGPMLYIYMHVQGKLYQADRPKEERKKRIKTHLSTKKNTKDGEYAN